MKRCNACDEEFEDRFSFCPVDGTPLNELAAALVGHHTPRDTIAFATDDVALTNVYSTRTPREFQVTMMNSAGLLPRLAVELQFVAYQLKQAWPQLKRDPTGFARREAVEMAHRFKRTVLTRDVLTGTVTAVFLVLSAVLSLILLGRAAPKHSDVAQTDLEDVIQFVAFDVPNQNDPTGAGVGAGSQGRVGFDRGKGEGSEREPKRASGGGGGGLHDPSDAQNGARRSPPRYRLRFPRLLLLIR